MNTSDFEITDKLSIDPLDRLIFEQGLRIKRLFFDVELDLMLVVLTNSKVLNLKLSSFQRLQNASLEQLTSYELEGEGVSATWPILDENLSVKGFIKQAAMEEAIHHLAKVA